jgi:hypothetical protein
MGAACLPISEKVDQPRAMVLIKRPFHFWPGTSMAARNAITRRRLLRFNVPWFTMFLHI